MTLIYDNNNVDDLLKRINKISNVAIQVGIFGDKDGEVLIYAGRHEFGDASSGIPERSFIRRTFDEKQSDINNVVDNMFGLYIDGNISYDVCTDAIGEYLVGLVRDMIVAIDSPPNSQKTIDKKGSSNPLIDTGRMIDSISYKVVEV